MLITHVMHIKWVNLQYLDLEDNWIQSVEMLAYLDAPEMRWINLKNNEIVQFSSLRKISFPKLRKLKLNTSSCTRYFIQICNILTILEIRIDTVTLWEDN